MEKELKLEMEKLNKYEGKVILKINKNINEENLIKFFKYAKTYCFENNLKYDEPKYICRELYYKSSFLTIKNIETIELEYFEDFDLSRICIVGKGFLINYYLDKL